MAEQRRYFVGANLVRIPSGSDYTVPPSGMPNLPQELIPQVRGGKAPRGGFIRAPSVGPTEVGGQYIHPGEAAWNAFKWKLPLGPAYSEQPTTGTWSTDPGKQLLSLIPLAGRPLAASAYAREHPVQWNPSMGGGERVWEIVKNLLGYAGYASKPALMLGRGIDVAQGIGSLFSPRTPAQDRTGVLRSMQAEAAGPRRDVPGGPSFAPGGSYYDLPQWSQWGPTPTAQPIQPAVVPSYGGDESLAFGGDMIPTSTNFGSTWDPADYWAGQGPQA